ncbi:MAG: aldose 1-epimerase family protein [Treponema sp.]|nr:aldose 1-epimerase family protein [Treponema sp.]
MIIKLENDNFTTEISTKGAELQSLIRKSDGKDIIWQGDKNVWGNHAPILFPFVARCWGEYFMIDGKKCEYTRNHGFARDLEWKCTFQNEDSATFELTQSEETLYRFPYSFCLKTEYKLTEKGIDWKITVKNTDKKAFKFGLGTHAAFSLNGNKAEDFVVEFEKKEALTAVCCTPDCFLVSDKDKKAPVTKPYGEKEAGIVPVTSAGFGNGHLFTNITSNWVGLRNLHDGSIIKIQTKGFPYCMLWQNTKGEPQFVCLEPWHGVTDSENSDHIWENKIGMNEVTPGKEFACEQNIWVE